MPCLKIFTNLPKSRIPSDFTDKIIPTLAKAVRKEENKFYCMIVPDTQMTIQQDSKSPGAIATLESIGNLGPDQNILISQSISEFVEKELGIIPKRLFLSFYDLKAYEVSVAGTTVQALGV